MAKQHISLGSSPSEESCAQVGVDGYELLARDECKRYVTLLRECYIAAHGAIPEGLTIKTTSNRHDYGNYLDVVVEFDSNDPQAVEAALWLDHNAPAEWPATPSFDSD